MYRLLYRLTFDFNPSDFNCMRRVCVVSAATRLELLYFDYTDKFHE